MKYSLFILSMILNFSCGHIAKEKNEEYQSENTERSPSSKAVGNQTCFDALNAYIKELEKNPPMYQVVDQIPSFARKEWQDIISELDKKNISYNFVAFMTGDGVARYAIEITPLADGHKLNQFVAENSKRFLGARVIIKESSEKNPAVKLKYYSGPNAIFMNREMIEFIEQDNFAVLRESFESINSPKTIHSYAIKKADYVKAINNQAMESMYQIIDQIPEYARKEWQETIADLEYKKISYNFVGYLKNDGSLGHAIEITPLANGHKINQFVAENSKRFMGARVIIKESSANNPVEKIKYYSGPNAIFMNREMVDFIEQENFAALRESFKSIISPKTIPSYAIKKADYVNAINNHAMESMYQIIDQIPEYARKEWQETIADLEYKKISYNFVGYLNNDGSLGHAIEITPLADGHKINQFVAENSKIFLGTRVIIKEKNPAEKIRYYSGPNAIFIQRDIVSSIDKNNFSILRDSFEDIKAPSKHALKKEDYPHTKNKIAESMYAVLDKIPPYAQKELYGIISNLEKKGITYNYVGYLEDGGFHGHAIEISPVFNAHKLNHFIAENGQKNNDTRVIILDATPKNSDIKIKHYSGPNVIFVRSDAVDSIDKDEFKALDEAFAAIK